MSDNDKRKAVVYLPLVCEIAILEWLPLSASAALYATHQRESYTYGARKREPFISQLLPVSPALPVSFLADCWTLQLTLSFPVPCRPRPRHDFCARCHCRTFGPGCLCFFVFVIYMVIPLILVVWLVVVVLDSTAK